MINAWNANALSSPYQVSLMTVPTGKFDATELYSTGKIIKMKTKLFALEPYESVSCLFAELLRQRQIAW